MLGLVSRPIRFNALEEQSYPRRRVSSGSRRAAFDDGYNPATTATPTDTSAQPNNPATLNTIV